MGDNLKIYSFEKELVDVCNKCTLPVMVKKMILKDLYESIEKLTEQKLKEEIEEYSNSKGEE